MKKATKAQSEKVLREVAAWLGRKGHGTMTACGECLGCTATDSRTVAVRARWASDTPIYCDNPKLGPAPTGPEAANSAQGPELVMDFDFLGYGAHPAIVLEGGPYEWTVECCYEVQQKCPKVFIEPVTGWALGIYPA